MHPKPKSMHTESHRQDSFQAQHLETYMVSKDKQEGYSMGVEYREEEILL